jgi:spermidine synthase
MPMFIKKILPIASSVTCLIMLTVGLLVFLPKWDKFEMSTSFLKPGQDVEGSYDIQYYDENVYGVISVVDFLPTNQKFLTTNRRFCQNSSDMFGPEDHRRLGIIPLLIHENPKDVLAVGLGAGITLGGANKYPGVNIDCVEISGSVVQAASYFGEENGHVIDADNVNMIIDDGRNFIKNTKKMYDVIIADIFFPMSSGSSSLFSREYYGMCKKKLNPNGIMTQWIPVHQFSTLELNITIKTFASVFENCQLWFGLIGTSIPVIGIVGSEKPVVIDGNRLARLYKNEALLKTLSEIALDDKYMMLSHFIADVKDTHLYREDIRISTDDKPILEYLNPESNTPHYQKGEENLFYASALKSAVPQTGFCKNVDEVTLEYYNTEIMNYIDRIFTEGSGQ